MHATADRGGDDGDIGLSEMGELASEKFRESARSRLPVRENKPQLALT